MREEIYKDGSDPHPLYGQLDGVKVISYYDNGQIRIVEEEYGFLEKEYKDNLHCNYKSPSYL